MSSLPIDNVLPELLASLESAVRVILHAPPGAGKTTRVPLSLLAAEWLGGQRIIMLEPRRLAARAAAYRMADSLGEVVGKTVGYRTRLDSQVSEQTRIEVVTEGVLTRIVQQDPELRGIGCIIFDEFHERNLNADLGLALTLDVQASLREDLRLLIMSATLNIAPLNALLGEVPVVASEGRCYPVDIRYLGGAGKAGLTQEVVAAVTKALAEESGSVLVFLPGESEIKHVATRLMTSALASNTQVMPLYGALSRTEQDLAIQPCQPGVRKVVLATSIAETSLTIEGVRIVIDAGLMRVARFDSRVGMGRLQTLNVSQASAEQRCGRAGRVEPGVCYRLWTAEQHKGLLKFHPPEIMSADLAPLVLELAQWGVVEPQELSWVDAVPGVAYNQARALLLSFGALNSHYRLTEHGRAMIKLGLHPRLAHMVVKGNALGTGALACDIAALLSERDIFNGRGVGVDLQYRLDVLHGDNSYQASLDRATLQRVKQAAAQLKRKLSPSAATNVAKLSAGVLLGFAYPDRIGVGRADSDGRLLLSNGKGARIDALDSLTRADFIVVASLAGQTSEPYVSLAAPIDKAALLMHFAELIVREEKCFWDDATQRVWAKSEVRLGALLLSSQQSAALNKAQAKASVLAAVAASKLKLLVFNKEQEQWLARVRLLASLLDQGLPLAQFEGDWPKVTAVDLIENLADWLGPYLDGVLNSEQLKRLDMTPILTSLLTWQQSQWLDNMLPVHYEAPTGSRIVVDYLAEDGPVLAVRLQEMFGLAETPSVAQGRVRLKLHLLSPARRPIQITRDLAGFWSGSYADVKKEMKGRYPKHYWPDDPLQAEPTTRVKNRR